MLLSTKRENLRRNHPKVVLIFLGRPRRNRTTDTRIFNSSPYSTSLYFQRVKPSDKNSVAHTKSSRIAKCLILQNYSTASYCFCVHTICRFKRHFNRINLSNPIQAHLLQRVQYYHRQLIHHRHRKDHQQTHEELIALS